MVWPKAKLVLASEDLKNQEEPHSKKPGLEVDLTDYYLVY